MSEVRLGIALWSQASDWRSFLDAGRPGRTARLRPRLDLGPPLRDLRRPGPADLRGVHRACGGRPGDGADQARPVRRRQHVPQPGPRREVGDDDRPHQRRAGHPGHRRRVVRDRARAFGLDFGVGFGQRLDWLAEAVPAIRTLFDGGDGHERAGRSLRLRPAAHRPPPVQAHLPLMIGGGGERKTLRIVAGYADIWNVFGMPETRRPQGRGPAAHCADVGRDPATIERIARLQGHHPRRPRPRRAGSTTAIIAHNLTPPERIAGDVTWWIGTSSRSRTRCEATAPSASTRSCARRPPRTTSRRWNCSSARSSRWSRTRPVAS